MSKHHEIIRLLCVPKTQDERFSKTWTFIDMYGKVSVERPGLFVFDMVIS